MRFVVVLNVRIKSNRAQPNRNEPKPNQTEPNQIQTKPKTTPTPSHTHSLPTLCPIWLRQSAAARPAGPEPTTATVIPVRCDGMRGTTQPSSNALSMMAYSMLLIVTGASTRPATQAPSQGAGHTRPVNSGKLFVCRGKRSEGLVIASHRVCTYT